MKESRIGFVKFKEQMNLHIKRVHEEIKNHVCKLCRKSFADSTDRSKHIKSAHKE